MMCGVLVAAAILLSAPCLAVDTVPPTDAHVLEWLNAPEHTDFDWKVQLFSPRLSFQQRRVAGIRAALPIRKLLRAGISLAGLRFVFKVADSDGHWMPGQYDDNFIPTADVQKAKELVFYAHFFVQPGRYKVAVLAYDRRTRRSNLWKREFEVPALKADPLPEADRNLPLVELPDESRPELAKLGGAKLHLPVHNRRPIRLDVVLNLALSDATNSRFREAPDWVYRSNAGVLLQIGWVLSQLDLQDGCVRLSAIDILRQQMFADRLQVAETNWDRLAASVEQLQRNRIDVHVLERQKITPALFARFLEQAVSDPAPCRDSGPAPRHVLLVVSDAFLFPWKTEMTAVRPELMPATAGYYLQVNPIAGATWDQIGKVLSPLHPRRWELSNAVKFRKMIAELIADLESMPDGGIVTQPRP